jgi:hypothetical protein
MCSISGRTSSGTKAVQPDVKKHKAMSDFIEVSVSRFDDRATTVKLVALRCRDLRQGLA